MRDAVESQSDLRMLQILGVGAHEMPDAIVALQHALAERHGPHGMATPNAFISQGLDPVEERFLQTGIQALQRVSGAGSAPLPMWRVTESDIDWVNSSSIGAGFSAEIFKCRWKGLAVAVKRLKIAIPYQLFAQEVRSFVII